jgi:hypothetical protein
MIKNEKQLLRSGIIFSIILLFIVTMLFTLSSISQVLFISIIIGFSISAINFILGLSIIKISLAKSEKIFLLALWGGVLLRLILGLILVLISLIFLEINTYGFIFSILFFYVFYLIIEIFYLNFGRKGHFGDYH